MTNSPVRFRRGDTSDERPGLLFWGMLRGKENWLSPERFEHYRKSKNALACKAEKTLEGRRQSNERSRKRAKLPHVTSYHADYQRRHRHIYSPRQRVRRTEYKKMRLATDPEFRLKHNLGVKMRSVIKKVGGQRKAAGTYALVGCTREFFRGWLESQFTDGMAWENYGTFWSVDHEKPVIGFDILSEEGQRAAFHYSNCKPVEKIDNCVKCDRIEFEGRTVRAGHLRKLNIIPFAIQA